MEIERNDVDLSSLFKWKADVNIKDDTGESVATVYMRLVGDADINKARVFALRRSGALRHQLRTPGTNEYEAFVAPIDTIEDIQRLIIGIKMLLLPELANKARQDIDLPLPTPPKSDASLEEQEKYQDEIDNYPTVFNGMVQEKITDYLDAEQLRLEKLSFEKLQKEYVEALIGSTCNREMLQAFQDMCIYHATFQDADFTQPAFKSFEDFENASLTVKRQLRDAYSDFEISMDSLKK